MTGITKEERETLIEYVELRSKLQEHNWTMEDAKAYDEFVVAFNANAKRNEQNEKEGRKLEIDVYVLFNQMRLKHGMRPCSKEDFDKTIERMKA